MLICVKSRFSELEQQTMPESRDLVSLIDDKSVPKEAGEGDSGKLKIVAKIFLNEFAENSVDESLECLLKNCLTTPTVILAYHPTSRTDAEKFVWGDNNAKSKENFKTMWRKLRAAQAAGHIAQLGIADMDLYTILDIFDDKKYDFTILQINTQTCCVVPPELQQFCKEHEIQLLTHSDPQGESSRRVNKFHVFK
jgi:glutamate--cysteine ligase regulatory subunit